MADGAAMAASRSSRRALTPSPASSSDSIKEEPHSSDRITSKARIDPSTTMGQFAFAPATQQTTVVTTTTTTINLAPFLLQPPSSLDERDPKQYPLLSTPTPAHLRNINIEIGGRLVSLKEPEDASSYLEQYRQQQLDLHHAGGSFTDTTSNVLEHKPSKLEAANRSPKHSAQSRPNHPPSLAAAAKIASTRRRSDRAASQGVTTRSHQSPPLAEEAEPGEQNVSSNLQLTNNSPRDYINARPLATDGVSVSTSTRGRSSRGPSQPAADAVTPTGNVLAAATPPIMDSDVETEAPALILPTSIPTTTSALTLATQQDVSLPSPSLSPVTAAANAAQRNSRRRHQVENDDVSDMSGLESDSRPRKRKLPPLFDAEKALVKRHEPDELVVAQEMARPATLMHVPDMIHTFDSLPEELQSYVMFQMLRRSSKKTLRTVADAVNPALKCDPFETLPLELSLKITKYLDGYSLGRASAVSKRWRHLINSDETAWRYALIREGYTLPAGELERAVREGWGWQITGPDEHEADLSARRPLRPLARNEWESAAATAGDSDYDTSSTSRNTRKRKASTMFGSSKRQKIKATGEDDMSWMRVLQKAQGPIAYASAAARAVPDPKIGLHSLKSLHLFKSIYRRHRLIRETWMDERTQPHHLAFRAHHRHVVTCLLFDSERIITGSDDTSINVFDTKTGVLRRRLEGHEGGVWALSCDGDTLVSGSTDRTVRVWDIKSGECMQVFQGHTSTVRCLVILKPEVIGKDETGRPIMQPEEPIIITGSRDSTLRVWKLPKPGDATAHDGDDGENPYALRTLTGHHNSVRAIAAHGDTLVSGSYDLTVRVWRISNGELVHRLNGHTAKVYSVVLDHERGRCISGSMDTLVKVWSLESGTCLFNLEGHTSLVGLLELNDNHLVSAAADSTLRVWDPENGACRSTLMAHTGAITCFQHDGQKVISGSDRTLKMWNIQNGECTRDLLTDLSGVWQVRFDERRCVAAVQRNSLTYIEVLDFGASRDGVPEKHRGRRIVVDHTGREVREEESTNVVAAPAVLEV